MKIEIAVDEAVGDEVVRGERFVAYAVLDDPSRSTYSGTGATALEAIAKAVYAIGEQLAVPLPERVDALYLERAHDRWMRAEHDAQLILRWLEELEEVGPLARCVTQWLERATRRRDRLVEHVESVRKIVALPFLTRDDVDPIADLAARVFAEVRKPSTRVDGHETKGHVTDPSPAAGVPEYLTRTMGPTLRDDFVAEVVADRTLRNPKFPDLVAEAEAVRGGSARDGSALRGEFLEGEELCPNCEQRHDGLYVTEWGTRHCGCYYDEKPVSGQLHTFRRDRALLDRALAVALPLEVEKLRASLAAWIAKVPL